MTRAAGMAIAVTAALALLLAACTAGAASSSLSSHAAPATNPATSSASRGGAPMWLLTRSALSQLVVDASIKDSLLAAGIYEILQPGQQPLPGVAAEPVVTFSSAATLERAVTGGQLPAGTYGVLYDPEAWSFTPAAEQRDPVAAATQAAAVAHAHGLRFIVTPALNLTTVLAPGRGGPRWQVFLDLQLAGQLAKVADAIEFQAQSLERDTATYTAFVRAAAAQASAAHPGMAVLAGLSTNPPGAPVSTQPLTSAIHATRSVVSGYWLNIPGPGPRCPACSAPRPDIAIETLQQLG